MKTAAPPTIELELRGPEYVPEFLRDGWRSRPWMKFFTRDWRGDPAVRRMPIDVRGVYVELIFADADQGFVERLTPELSRSYGVAKPELSRSSAVAIQELSRSFGLATGVDARQVRRIFPLLADHFFITSDGHVINKRQERERRSARKEREKKRGQRANVPELSPPMSPDTRARHSESEPEHTPTECARRAPAHARASDHDPDILDRLMAHPWSFGALKARSIRERGTTSTDLEAWEKFAVDQGRPAAVSALQQFARPSDVPADPASRRGSKASARRRDGGGRGLFE